MSAKTRGDLDGLFDDLPDPEPAGAPGAGGKVDASGPYRMRRRHGGRPILMVALVVALAIVLGHAVAAVFVPWFWVAALVVAIVFVTRSTRARHDR